MASTNIRIRPKKVKEPVDPKKNTTITRKPKRTIEDLSSEDKYKVLEDYTSGQYSINELRDKWRLNHSDSLITFINGTITKLNIIKETSSINPATQSHYLNYKPTNLVNEPFLDLLSPPTDTLTDEELTYAYLYVFTGDNQSAVEQSGLDAGLNNKRIVKDTPAYAYAMRVRGLLLRNKPNVQSYINALREEKLKDNREVNKAFIIEELVDQLNQMKEEGKERRLILETIKLLGQTCSAFTERIEIGTIDPSRPVDALIEMAMREAASLPTHGQLKQLPAGSDCDYEVVEGDV